MKGGHKNKGLVFSAAVCRGGDGGRREEGERRN